MLIEKISDACKQDKLDSKQHKQSKPCKDDAFPKRTQSTQDRTAATGVMVSWCH